MYKKRALVLNVRNKCTETKIARGLSICTWELVGSGTVAIVYTFIFYTFYFFISLLYIIYFIIFYSLLFFYYFTSNPKRQAVAQVCQRYLSFL